MTHKARSYDQVRALRAPDGPGGNGGGIEVAAYGLIIIRVQRQAENQSRPKRYCRVITQDPLPGLGSRLQ